MDDKKYKYENDSSGDERSLYVFTAILFLVGLGLFMIALFIFAWACDYWGIGPAALPEGWY